MDVLDERDFTGFMLTISFGRITFIATALGLRLEAAPGPFLGMRPANERRRYITKKRRLSHWLGARLESAPSTCHQAWYYFTIFGDIEILCVRDFAVATREDLTSVVVSTILERAFINGIYRQIPYISRTPVDN